MKSKSMYHSLLSVCGKLSYNTGLIFNLLDSEGFSKKVLKTIHSSIRGGFADQIPSLNWNSDFRIDKDAFLDAIIKTGAIKNMQNFKMLFENPNKNLRIILDQNRVSYVIQLLAFLKESRLICANNCQGFYKVFQYHVVEFNEKFLKNQEPGKRVDSVKKLKSWQKNLEIFKVLFCNSIHEK